MDDRKTFASLSPTLLARKGGAKPAMRQQFQALRHDATAHHLDVDDNYNDFGDDETPLHQAEVVAFKTRFAGSCRRARGGPASSAASPRG